MLNTALGNLERLVHGVIAETCTETNLVTYHLEEGGQRAGVEHEIRVSIQGKRLRPDFGSGTATTE